MAVAEPIFAPPFDDLTALPRQRLAAMRRAARDLFDVLDAFARAGGHPVRDVLTTSPDPFTRWERYPLGDVEDRATGCAWYYHAHDPSPARPWEEHGHFHCYLYTELLPANAKPIALPAHPDFEKGGLVHLVAISLDLNGMPVRLFTINRWASDEWMYPAGDIIPLIDRFEIGNDTRFALTSRWLGVMLRILRPQIAWLLHERDRFLGEYRTVDPAGATEDESIDVTSTVTFNLDDHLAALERAWQRKARRRYRSTKASVSGHRQI